MSDDEQNLNEIIVASCFHESDLPKSSTSTGIFSEPSTSKCHKNIFVEEANKIVNTDDGKKSSIKHLNVSSLDPKSSKIRRTEYSMKGLRGSNPSEDSAFGSMTDGEMSHASSFKLSSFQSISSPIDEGMEDAPQNILNISKPVNDTFTQSLNDLTPLPLRETIIKETFITFNPPQLLINDGNFNLSASPIKNSEKLVRRRSSLEDFSSKKSADDEQRIEDAFTPISEMNHEIYMKKLTAKERKGVWKDSFLKNNKNNLTIRPSESMNSSDGLVEMLEKEQSNDEEDDETSTTENSSSFTPENRRLGFFSLIKLKQSAIESMALDNISEISTSKSNKFSTSCSSNDESNTNLITTSTTDFFTEISDDDDDFSSLSENLALKSPSRDEIKIFTDCFESDSGSVSAGNHSLEAFPLLGISSSVDTE